MCKLYQKTLYLCVSCMAVYEHVLLFPSDYQLRMPLNHHHHVPYCTTQVFMSLHRYWSILFWTNSNYILSCNHLRPHSNISLGLPLPPLTVLFVTMSLFFLFDKRTLFVSFLLLCIVSYLRYPCQENLLVNMAVRGFRNINLRNHISTASKFFLKLLFTF